ncbi:MAG: peptide deformylase [Termitinemataceae bacterium]|nr:MAG: peptide deformylase [Termitinemataceae bacterium]
MQVVKLGDDALRQKSVPVKAYNDDFKSTCSEMLELLHKHKGVGLAAVQVGILQRFFVVHLEDDVPRVFVNPSIISTSEETVSLEEGCLSLPGVWSDVVRPKKIIVQAWNEDAKTFTIEATGLLARVILHEYDHLEGVLFPDRLSELKRERLMSKYEKQKDKAFKKKKKIAKR